MVAFAIGQVILGYLRYRVPDFPQEELELPHRSE
jgi:hypothetical protein